MTLNFNDPVLAMIVLVGGAALSIVLINHKIFFRNLKDALKGIGL